ncbi:hypothetical protein [Lacinutrix jangbogonensis]|uniref:hypothetical protein n=1 Tax=Lacinutrix jangbogonensis TaxID=1469557 RepID=UPI00053D42A4|nr:hypothetical protein [Lacinutrix jangbogonensis]
MLKEEKKRINVHGVSILLLLFFITEAYFKVVLFSTGEISLLPQVTKGITFVCLTLYLLIKKPKQLLVIGGLFITFLIGQIAIANGFSISILIAFIKLIFPILLLLFFLNYKLSDSQRELLFMFFEYIMLFNAFMIIVGVLFNVEAFHSYLGDRFGFNGLFVSTATGSYAYCIALICLFAKYKKAVFKKIPNLIIIFSMFFIGTKVCYLFLFSFFVIYLWKYMRFNKKIVGCLLLLFSCMCVYFVFFKFGIFNEIRQKHGLMSSLMSYRDVLFLERTLPFIKGNWSIVNYLFGGVSDLKTKSQMEFVDIFYFFGIIGGFFYYSVFFKAFLIFKPNIYITILLSVLFIIVLLAGNFFSYPSVAIYIVVLREYLKLNEQNQHTQYAYSQFNNARNFKYCRPYNK